MAGFEPATKGKINNDEGLFKKQAEINLIRYNVLH